MAVIHSMPVLFLDASGYPRNHREAEAEAAKVLREMVNDLPEWTFCLNQTDAEWIASEMVRAYMGVARKVQP